MEASPGVVVETLDTLGSQGWIRLNHLLPPFDDARAREAVLWAIDQTHYLQATVGNPDYYEECAAYFGCGTTFETDIGTEALMRQDLDRAAPWSRSRVMPARALSSFRRPTSPSTPAQRW